MLDLERIFDPDQGQQLICIMPNEQPDLPTEIHFLWDKRAAIMEYDGGLPREQAEARAYEEVVGRRHYPDRDGT